MHTFVSYLINIFLLTLSVIILSRYDLDVDILGHGGEGDLQATDGSSGVTTLYFSQPCTHVGGSLQTNV